MNYTQDKIQHFIKSPHNNEEEIKKLAAQWGFEEMYGKILQISPCGIFTEKGYVSYHGERVIFDRN